MPSLVILLLSTGGIAITALLVLANNHRSATNRWFSAFAASLVVWPLLNYLSLHTSHHLLFMRLVMATATCIMGSFYFLARTFPDETFRFSTRHKLVLAYLAATTVASLSPWLFEAVIIGQRGNLRPQPGPAMVLFMGLLVYVLPASFASLYRHYRTAQTPRSRLQIRYLLYSSLLLFAFILLFNFVLPIAVHNSSLVSYGPLFNLVFSSVIAYAMIHTSLFDIRIALARSAAYFMAIGTITIGYFALILIISHVFIHDISISLKYQLINVAIALFVGMTFQPIKRFFDKVTDRIFFRDSYDAPELLDGLNRLFVANTNLEHLLRESADIIEENLKTEFCYFGIRESEQSPPRIVGRHSRPVSAQDITLIRHTTPHIHQKIIVVDELGKKYEDLRTTLQRNQVAVLGRLTPTTGRTVEGMGYLVLGQRRSGNPYTQKDLRTLETIVNELVIAIENSLRFEEIQHFNETLQQNVSEATRKLRRTNDKLQALDATKDEFITMASHQLRTPLTSVKGYLSMVLEGDAGKLNAQQKQLLTQSYISSQRMVYLISDLLNLSRLNTGKFVIEPSPTDLTEVVQGEVNQLAETAKSRNITLDYARPADFPRLMLDETKIHQVVMNFIDNAIYYTPAGGQITVSLHETPAAIEYRVKDTGIGVPRNQQHHLFTKFYRAENARKARPDGTGLGLFMAKKIIAAQGGAIIFESVEGKGSTFGFRFNKKQHQMPEST